MQRDSPMIKQTIVRTILIAAVLCVVFCPANFLAVSGAHAPSLVPSAMAQDAATQQQAQAKFEREVKKSLIDYYFAGGFVMHFILLCSVARTGLIVELIFRLRVARV